MTTPVYPQHPAAPHWIEPMLPAMTPRPLPLDERCSLREGGHAFSPATLRCVYCTASLDALVARSQAQTRGVYVA